MTSREIILSVLKGEVPRRPVFAPNIWQWFEYQKLHGLLPAELAHCTTQLDVLKHLGVDIFSRNLRADIHREWIGGHSRFVYHNVEVVEEVDGNHRRLHYKTPAGELTESFLFDTTGCTLVQEEYLFKNFERDFPAIKHLYANREYVFDAESYNSLNTAIGEAGLPIVGEITTPLKQLHFHARADQSVYLLFDHEKEMMELMDLYAESAVTFIRTLVTHHGVKVVMSMDNLDSLFYPPPYFQKYCAGFFSKLTEICREAGAFCFSHACGRQRDILRLTMECGLNGLEGIAFPPLGDIELWEARKATAGSRFIIDGGLSALQLEGDVTSQEADRYVTSLFQKMQPYDRFILGMSCNTSIRTKWETLLRYRDAWMKHCIVQ